MRKQGRAGWVNGCGQMALLSKFSSKQQTQMLMKDHISEHQSHREIRFAFSSPSSPVPSPLLETLCGPREHTAGQNPGASSPPSQKRKQRSTEGHRGHCKTPASVLNVTRDSWGKNTGRVGTSSWPVPILLFRIEIT